MYLHFLNLLKIPLSPDPKKKVDPPVDWTRSQVVELKGPQVIMVLVTKFLTMGYIAGDTPKWMVYNGQSENKWLV